MVSMPSGHTQPQPEAYRGRTRSPALCRHQTTASAATQPRTPTSGRTKPAPTASHRPLSMKRDARQKRQMVRKGTRICGPPSPAHIRSIGDKSYKVADETDLAIVPSSTAVALIFNLAVVPNRLLEPCTDGVARIVAATRDVVHAVAWHGDTEAAQCHNEGAGTLALVHQLRRKPITGAGSVWTATRFIIQPESRPCPEVI